MRLVFIDESARDRAYYFFGALIADAAAVRSIEEGLEGLATLLSDNVPGFEVRTEFHAVDMYHGKNEWSAVPVAWRVKACRLVAKVLSRSSAVFVFRGVDLRALRYRYGNNAHPAHLLTLAHLLEEVDGRLNRLDAGDPLGLVLADEHHSAAGARRSLRHFKREQAPGYTKRPFTNIGDTIYFGPSHESRMLQATDLATYFLNRAFTVEERDPRAKRAVSSIVRHIRSITVHEYVWCPEKTQRPARWRGVG